MGSIVTLYSRQLKVIDYGDDFTRAKMQTKHERCATLPAPLLPALLLPPPPLLLLLLQLFQPQKRA